MPEKKEEKAPEKPTVGRIVHVTSETRGAACLPAMVVATANEGQFATLAVINTDGSTTMKKDAAAGDWHWPERS